MHDWPLFTGRARGDRDRRGVVHVRVREHDERIRAAEFEHGLLERGRRGGRDRRPAARCRERHPRRPRRARSARRRCRARAASRTRPRAPASRSDLDRRAPRRARWTRVLSATALPAMSAGAAAGRPASRGKFHGMIGEQHARQLARRAAARVASVATDSSASRRSACSALPPLARPRTSRLRPRPARSACPSRSSRAARATAARSYQQRGGANHHGRRAANGSARPADCAAAAQSRHAAASAGKCPAYSCTKLSGGRMNGAHARGRCRSDGLQRQSELLGERGRLVLQRGTPRSAPGASARRGVSRRQFRRAQSTARSRFGRCARPA